MLTRKEIPACPKCILLADDDHALRMVLGQIMTLSGYKVTYAENGKMALKQYQKTPDTFDLLITDICMPELNGDDLIREIRKLDDELPIIAITGFARPEMFQNAKVYKATIFEKPLNFSDLIDYINALWPD